MFFTCLYATDGLAAAAVASAGRPRTKHSPRQIEARWRGRADRGAEERVEMRDRSAFVPVSALRADPHLEMHKRGG